MLHGRSFNITVVYVTVYNESYYLVFTENFNTFKSWTVQDRIGGTFNTRRTFFIPIYK